MTDEELIAMARLAQRDDRMPTGASYGDLADRIEALIAEMEAMQDRLDVANKSRAHVMALAMKRQTRIEELEAERDAAVEALDKSETMLRIRGQNSMADEISATVARIKEKRT